MDCTGTRKLIRKAFVRGDARLLARTRPHLTGCGPCGETYHRLYAAEASLAAALHALEPSGDQPALPDDASAGGEPDWEASILSAPEVALLRAQVLPSPTRRRWRFVALLSPALAASLALMLLYVPRRPPPDRMTARGTSSDGGAATAAPLGLRAVCLVRSDAGIEVRSIGSRLPGGKTGCFTGDRLGLMVRNETKERQHLNIFLLTADDRARQIFSDSGSELISPSAEIPLDVTVELLDNDVGDARIIGVFSTQKKDPRLLLDKIVKGEIPTGVQVVQLRLEIDRQ